MGISQNYNEQRGLDSQLPFINRRTSSDWTFWGFIDILTNEEKNLN